MRAWILPEPVGIDALQLVDLPEPSPDAGEAVLELDFAALNPADRYLAEKLYPAKPSWPHVLGRDGLGTVVAVGPGVTEVKVGDRRVILRSEIGVSRQGTFAQRVAVPVASLATWPAGWSDEQAAGAPLVYLTAWQALTMWDLPAPTTVLITGASGGVGVAAVQLASAMGHRVVAMSRSPEKRKRLQELGAAFTFDASEARWSEQVREALGGRKVGLAIDNIGGDEFASMIDTLGGEGRVSVVGALAGPVPQFNTSTLLFRRIRVGGVAVGSYTPEQAQAAWWQIQAALERAGHQPVVDSVFPFAQLPQAFARLAGGPMGKVVLRVREG